MSVTHFSMASTARWLVRIMPKTLCSVNLNTNIKIHSDKIQRVKKLFRVPGLNQSLSHQ